MLDTPNAATPAEAAEINASPLRTLLPSLAPFEWRDCTDAMRERGFAQLRARYIEIRHDAGWTIASLEDFELVTFLGVEISDEFASTVAADVLGRCRYEADLTLADERVRDSQLPEVA